MKQQTKHKIKILFCFVIISILFSGCITVSTREKLLKQLKSAGYIDSNWTFVELNYGISNSILFDVGGYEYIYKDKNDVLYKVSIPNELDDEFYVTIYEKVVKNEIKNPYNKKETIFVYQQEEYGKTKYITMKKEETKLLYGFVVFNKYKIVNN